VAEILLEMTGIQKYFPGVHALDNASLCVNKGEVHALVGENGAGKSTLMKVLAGIYKKDGGTIKFRGKEIEPTDPRHSQKLGIGIIHQELNMMPHLTVAQNIFIGKAPKRGIFLDQTSENRQAREMLKALNIDINPTIQAGKLTVAKQQMVEIAKALSYDSELLVMDEPTAALTDNEIQELFKVIRDLKSKGHGIIYISHRLDELPQISDRITVMRDGQYIGTEETKDITKEKIINMMVGRTIYEEPKTKSNVQEGAPVLLKVEHLMGSNVRDVSFELRKGEILGFAGLMGAGRTETMRVLFGADPSEGGTITINGKKVTIKSPNDAIANGICYLSEDRKALGLAIGLSLRDNCVMANMDEFMIGPFTNDKKIDAMTQEYIEKIGIKTPSTRQLVKNLSGGNQQKAVIAKWLIRNSDILIFDEPTRGIDVGAKQEIYKLMNTLADEGKSIIMISSEMPELLRMSDRLVVMREGCVTGELDIADVTQEKIMTLATMNM
jgi:ribose transport system ATP-binding protein